jgi:hypothetical protein
MFLAAVAEVVAVSVGPVGAEEFTARRKVAGVAVVIRGM